MEAVPRLPMVCFELRTPTESTNFGPKLKEYIRDFYNEDPDTYSLEINQLETLRAAAIRPGRDVSGVATLKRYYCQLHFLMSRFPMTKDGAAAVHFSWRDMYVGMSFSVPDIRYEISSILYNIGALHTQLGMSDTRTTEDGMKMTCTHFQCAAWAFQHLKDTYPPSTEADLAPDIMQFAYHLCLAQAQECILEKSMMDSRKASIIVKVAVQVVNYYSQAFNALKQSASEEAVGTKIYSGWRRLAKFKEIYYRCVIQLFQGIQAEEQQKMGERVAFYQLAHDTLEEAIKLSKNLDKIEMNPKQVQDALSFTMDVVEGKRKAAKNENEFIYHEEVPDRDQLPKAMGVSLVKGIPFSINDPEVSGPDIFGRLVPMKAHEASSLYSEEKAKLLRKVGGSIEEKDQLLIAFLSSLQLEYLHCYSEPNQLPQELVDRCAALSAKPNAIQSLVESMSKLSDLCTEVETMLQQIKTFLEEEDALEKEYQAIMGKRPPSIVATDMTREFAKYQEAHAKANESNQALHKVMSTHISNLRILSLPLSQLQQQIPPPPSLSDLESEDIVKEMQTLMEKVEEMRNQRSMLTSQLRDSICNDDITQLLVTHQNENMDSLFQEELKKHQDVVKLIQQNLAAQDNILKAVTDAYARYSTVRKATADAVKKRQSVINALISCFDAYEDLLAKSSKGHEFYNILETNVSKLLGRVRSTCKVQQEEREQMLLKNSSSSLPLRNLPNVSDINSLSATKAHAGPKLKDYLKTDGSLSSSLRASTNYPSSDLASSGYTVPGLYNQIPGSGQSATYYDSTVTANASVTNISVDSKPQNWMPGVRPAPLGSEATSSAFKPEPNDSKSVPYPSQSPNLIQSVHPHQVYNYAGTWGYGSQASTMSTYLPTSVQYSVDSKPNDPSNLYSAHQPSTYNVDQGYRYTPVGGASYETPNNDATASSYVSSQACHAFSGGYMNVPSQVIAPPNQVAESSSSTVYQFQQDPNYFQSSYQNYQAPVVAPLNHQYNVPSVPSSLQNPTLYENSHAMTSAGYEKINTYKEPAPVSQPSDQVMASGYSNASSTIQTSNTISYQAVASYEQPTASGYHDPRNITAGSVTPANVYQYDQSYQQGLWPAPSGSTANLMYQNYHVPSSSCTSQFQYMGNQNISSYSSAGSYPTNQTSSSYSPNVPNYTCNTSPAAASVAYYQSPPYGSQYQSGVTGSSTVVEGPPSISQQDYHAQGMYNTQARMPNSDSYTTDSPKTSRSSFSESSSNVDLLAGLDFSINQQPLVPQQGQPDNKTETKDSTPGRTQTDVMPKKIEVSERLEQSVPKNGFAKSADALIDSINVLQTQNDNTIKNESQKAPTKDLFQDLDYLHQFTQEVEKYEKFVEGLTLKTLNGPTPLDMKWKEINELQERDAHRRSISVARCYPMKNRFPDILPYDCSRVELPSTKDDYINASHLKDLTPTTLPFILTQLPLPSTYNDFWIMVHEQQVEVIVCLLSDMELDGQRYWPVEKSEELSLGRMRLNLQTSNIKQHWTERIISVYDAETRVSRIVIHLQFTAWPGSSFPASPGPFLTFVSECLAFHSQQRVTSHPLVVHCLSGVGRTGLFCLAAASICEVQAGHGLIDLVKLTAAMSERRKGALRDREHLKFAYLSLLYYAQDMLMKCGILTCGSSFEEKRIRSEGKCHTRHPSQDFLLGPPTGLSQLQSGIEKMGLDAPNQNNSHESYGAQNKTEDVTAATTSLCSPTSTSAENVRPADSSTSHLTDLSQLKPHANSKDGKHSRYTPESFKIAGQVHLANVQVSEGDPFSGIDPLWPLKRKQDLSDET